MGFTDSKGDKFADEMNVIFMNQQKIKSLYSFNKNYLLENSLPFWLNHSLDHTYNGYLTCLDREGKAYNTDKSVWFQGRGIWIYSKVYNSIERNQKYIEAAKIGYNFLIDHCYDTDGRMFFQLTREGKPLRKRRYMFSEMFAIIACAEYFKATGDESALRKAKDTYKIVLELLRNPSRIEPKIIPKTRVTKSLSPYMMMISTIQILREADHDPEYDIVCKEMIDSVLSLFYKPEEMALFETVGSNGERIDSPQGRCINPGHSIETAWFLIHEGLYLKDHSIVDKALQIIDWSIDLGWDKDFGGLYSFVDIEKKPCEQLEWDMKMWWPHTEALYALLLAHYVSGNDKYEKWFDIFQEWSFSHFEDSECGEWYGYLHRDGTIANQLKGSMWKGPFHLPRALLLNTILLEKMMHMDNSTHVNGKIIL